MSRTWDISALKGRELGSSLAAGSTFSPGVSVPGCFNVRCIHAIENLIATCIIALGNNDNSRSSKGKFLPNVSNRLCVHYTQCLTAHQLWALTEKNWSFTVYAKGDKFIITNMWKCFSAYNWVSYEARNHHFPLVFTCSHRPPFLSAV